MLTRKHYRAIAKVLWAARQNLHNTSAVVLKQITDDLCDVLREDNPAFNREKFLKACGVDEE